MTIKEAKIQERYKIISIDTKDEELNSFLLTLGCYPNETITVVSHISNNYTIAIKDARYSIDGNLAQAIVIA
ncbi:MAG: FeoA family protein [Erysipelotrichaceae bacterium]